MIFQTAPEEEEIETARWDPESRRIIFADAAPEAPDFWMYGFAARRRGAGLPRQAGPGFGRRRGRRACSTPIASSKICSWGSAPTAPKARTPASDWSTRAAPKTAEASRTMPLSAGREVK